LELKRKSSCDVSLKSNDFAITDSSYGVTLDIYQCTACGLLQCLPSEKVLDFYVDLEDTEYEDTKMERALQAEKIITIIKRHKPEGTLFDVGAGSGIFVEEALKAGYVASRQNGYKHRLFKKSYRLCRGFLMLEM
jgi:hypothetical protein